MATRGHCSTTGFETTQWEIFREAATCYGIIDLHEYTEPVIGYINNCIENVTCGKNHQEARRNLTKGIREAKRLYAEKLNSHFTNDKDINT